MLFWINLILSCDRCGAQLTKRQLHFTVSGHSNQIIDWHCICIWLSVIFVNNYSPNKNAPMSQSKNMRHTVRVLQCLSRCLWTNFQFYVTKRKLNKLKTIRFDSSIAWKIIIVFFMCVYFLSLFLSKKKEW